MMDCYCRSQHPCSYALHGKDGTVYCGEDNIGCAHKEIVPEIRAAKDTEGKGRPTLVPVSLIEAVTAVRMFGTAKYGSPDNWKKVDKQDYKDALYRHWLKYLKADREYEGRD